eukprot:Nk52_evm6s96 gene=Nk52_evmTU6s96
MVDLGKGQRDVVSVPSATSKRPPVGQKRQPSHSNNGNHHRLPKSPAGGGKRGKSGGGGGGAPNSIEQFLLDHYIAEISSKKKANAVAKKYAHTGVVTGGNGGGAGKAETVEVTSGSRGQRPWSATNRSITSDTGQGASAEVGSGVKRVRPSSAPSKRPNSSHVGGVNSRRSPFGNTRTVFGSERKVKASLYTALATSRGKGVRVCVFRNGTLEKGISIVALQFEQFLDDCTKRLKLNTSARRVFTIDGIELTNIKQFERASNLYISQGEPFRNPYKSYRDLLTQPALDKNRQLSGSFERLCQQTKKRVLVYRNGESSGGVEIVAHGIAQLLTDSTARLKLNGLAKKFFNLEGQVIESLETISREPVWVSIGENFNRRGPKVYISNLLSKYQEKLIRLKEEEARAESKRDRDSLLKINNEKRALNGDIASLKARISDIPPEEERTTTIPEISEESRLLQKPALKLRLFKNGTSDKYVIGVFKMDSQNLYKDIDEFKSSMLKRVLDLGTKMLQFRICAKRIFNEDGKEIVNVLNLVNDQNIWVSTGEEFSKGGEVILGLDVTKKFASKVVNGEEETIVRRNSHYDGSEPINDSNIARLSSSNYFVAGAFPSDGKTVFQSGDIYDEIISDHKCFIQDKRNEDIVISPEVDGLSKKKIGFNLHQRWVLTREGLICSRLNPNIVLGVDMESPEENKPVKPMVLSREDSTTQEWGFDHLGSIYLLSDRSLALACKKTQTGSLKICVETRKISEAGCVLSASQRWGLQAGVNVQSNKKVKHIMNLFQIDNANFVRKKLFWPWYNVYEYQHDRSDSKQSISKQELPPIPFPLDVFLVPFAPELKPVEARPSLFSKVQHSLRLRVLKNGVKDHGAAVKVVAPLSPITNNSKAEAASSSNSEKYANMEALEEAIMDKFLDKCTSALKLPNAARKLFGEDGVPIKSLSDVTRDELVWVSSGEPWISSDVLNQSSQRSKNINKMSNDIAKLKEYYQNSDYFDLVVELETPDDVNWRAVVQHRKINHKDLQKWSITPEGFIQCKKLSHLVLAIHETNAKSGCEVLMVSKFSDSHHTKWNMTDDGMIQSQTVSDLYLTVTRAEGPGTVLTAAPKKSFMNANQKWKFSNGFLESYSCSRMEKQLTAAVRYGLCTYTITGKNNALQYAYEITDTQDGQGGTQTVCMTCAHVCQAHRVLKVITSGKEFYCACGDTNRKLSKLKGGDKSQLKTTITDRCQCFGGKVDLHLAGEQDILDQMKSNLDSLKKETKTKYDEEWSKKSQLKTLSKESATRLRVYRNGDHDEANSVTVVVGPLRSMLDRCTKRLKLHNAARKLYTKDGNQILDVKTLTNMQEVWVTCGEPYKNPQDVKRITDLKVQLYQEKKQLKELQSNRSPSENPSMKETQLLNYVKQLEYHLYDAQLKTSFDPLLMKKMKQNKRLYPSPSTVKIYCWKNGDDSQTGVSVYGSDMETILDNATKKLGLTTSARRLFKIPEGKPLKNFSDISPEDKVWVSCGESFKHPQEERRHIKLKAQWSKEKRMKSSPKVLIKTIAGRTIPKSINSEPSIHAPPSEVSSDESELSDIEMVSI